MWLQLTVATLLLPEPPRTVSFQLPPHSGAPRHTGASRPLLQITSSNHFNRVTPQLYHCHLLRLSLPNAAELSAILSAASFRLSLSPSFSLTFSYPPALDANADVIVMATRSRLVRVHETGLWWRVEQPTSTYTPFKSLGSRPLKYISGQTSSF